MKLAPLLFLVLLTPAAATEAITGRASVIDGDTIEIHGKRIRLWGIDAPEGRQPCTRDGKAWRCGAEAANALDRHLDGATVACTVRDIDRYRRVVATCEARGRDVGDWLVSEGWALDYRQYSKGAYAAAEATAKDAGRGVWGGEFEPPWEWRRR
ncbi:thermonuclease family protein [Microbaculum marinisediminis]|uniref:Thermonuclease family protein n=1 Tax=Microbaculum marinisediminis TaxID=2931392 RepID=A0AAW5QS57_9HYPH|nr:thermonuclease family protein [Microbaculum sp. A6E488]MCT8970886.1 thermonuclease family protein [Microbaculum sp. A6E488]